MYLEAAEKLKSTDGLMPFLVFRFKRHNFLSLATPPPLISLPQLGGKDAATSKLLSEIKAGINEQREKDRATFSGKMFA